MKKVFTTFLCIALLCSAFAQNDQSLKSEIEAIENGLIKNIIIKGTADVKYNILERMEHYNVPGVSIAVVKDGELRWAKGYGTANTETGQKVNTTTLFQAGSISKPIAALSALQLYEMGKLDLQQDVNQYLIGWKIPENRYTIKEKVTTQKLLTHTAGTTVHGFPGYQQTDTFPEIIEVLNGTGNTDRVSVDTFPGSIWRYSGGGYTVMEKVVEDVSGKSLEDYMSQNILLPLGMTNSTYQQPIPKELQNNISAAYNGNGQIAKGLWHNYPEQAAAGLWTTPSDLAIYCLEVQGILNNKKAGLLKEETIKLMLTKGKNDWGLGPSLTNEGVNLLFKHGGKNEGFTNNMIASAHQGFALIIMTNADNGGSLIAEIQNAVSHQYNWSISNPKTIDVIDITETELQPYLGKYKLEQMGLVIDLILKDNKLYTQTPMGPLSLHPTSNTNFIDIDNGARVKFEFDDGETKMIVNNNFELIKVTE